MTDIGGAAEPECGLRIVRRQRAAARVNIADERRGLRVAGERRAPQPAFARVRVGLHAVAL